MERRFCDRCGAEIPVDNNHSNPSFIKGQYTAILAKVVQSGPKDELYPAEYCADLCDKCQDIMTDYVQNVFLAPEAVEG